MLNGMSRDSLYIKNYIISFFIYNSINRLVGSNIMPLGSVPKHASRKWIGGKKEETVILIQ